jgi:hypothetical protein
LGKVDKVEKKIIDILEFRKCDMTRGLYLHQKEGVPALYDASIPSFGDGEGLWIPETASDAVDSISLQLIG